MSKFALFQKAMLKRHNIIIDGDAPPWIWLIPWQTLIPCIDAYTKLPNPISAGDMIVKAVLGDLAVNILPFTDHVVQHDNVTLSKQKHVPYKSPWSTHLSVLFEGLILDDDVYEYVTNWNLKLNDELIGYDIVFHVYNKSVCVCEWNPTKTLEFMRFNLLLPLTLFEMGIEEMAYIWPNTELNVLPLSTFSTTQPIPNSQFTKLTYFKNDVEVINRIHEILTQNQ